MTAAWLPDKRRPNGIASNRAVRAALYLRVSTDRQRQGDVSIPSQRSLTQAHCDREGWAVVDEYVESRTATDDRRTIFQAMIDRACDADRPYDVIVVHAFSRFYRDGAESELVIRKLRRHGVEVVSITQPTGTDPSAQMMRQIIGIFDEYTSKENGKQVTRAMLENAAQGFWNGASPPLGYVVIEAERRGQKIKKKLAIDPVEKELVLLIFRLYVLGDPRTGTPPLGIKTLACWLNEKGFTTKSGGAFGVGPLHHILTNTVYVGRWRYNVRSSRTGEKKPEDEVRIIEVPPIVGQATFDAVQAKLAANNPRVSSPRAATGPILLTGLATCAHCNGGMTQRTGTSSTGRIYSYYTCATKAKKGSTGCRGNSVPMGHLDRLVLAALDTRLFAPERLTALLSALIERRADRAAALDSRLVGLQEEVAAAEEKLRRLYRLVEEDEAETDDILTERITMLKAERARAKAALDRARGSTRPAVEIGPEQVVAFSRHLREVLVNEETPARKVWLKALLARVEVDDKQVRLVGSTEVLHAAVAAASRGQNVRSSVPEWRARKDSNL